MAHHPPRTVPHATRPRRVAVPQECIKFIQTFRFTKEHIDFLRGVMPNADAAFFDYLAGLDCRALKVFAVAEGTVVFPRVPLLRVEGPLAIAQLVETSLLNLCNYASLVCTNAARFRLAAGANKTLLEFGLRRAQGPDGAMSASRYSFMGGFDGTSNLLAAFTHGITPMGTHAHSLVSAFVTVEDLPCRTIDGVDVVAAALRYRSELGFHIASNGELAAFIAYAQAFPTSFLALVDTYDTLASGVPNFLAVALALRDRGYAALGVRLDSGDLAYLSKETRRLFAKADEKYGTSFARDAKVVASNDINESVLISLNDQGHEVDTFGIGTNLVTCQAQPALGMVYKLVDINGVPRIKLSQDVSKVTIPGAKEAFRLIGAEGVPLLDMLIRVGEARPQPGKRVLCRHPFDEKRRVYVTPTAVIPLLRLVWKGWAAPLDEKLASDEALRGTAADGPVATGSSAAPHDPPPSAGLVPVPHDDPSSVSAGDGTAAASPARPRSASAGAAPVGTLPGLTTLMSPSAFPAGVSMRARFPSLAELRSFVKSQLNLIREDHLRPLNPTPYKVSVSS